MIRDDFVYILSAAASLSRGVVRLFRAVPRCSSRLVLIYAVRVSPRRSRRFARGHGGLPPRVLRRLRRRRADQLPGCGPDVPHPAPPRRRLPPRRPRAPAPPPLKGGVSAELVTPLPVLLAELLHHYGARCAFRRPRRRARECSCACRDCFLPTERQAALLLFFNRCECCEAMRCSTPTRRNASRWHAF